MSDNQLQLPAPIDQECAFNKTCHFVGRCIKNTSIENVRKYKPDWASIGTRYGWSFGVGVDVSTDLNAVPVDPMPFRSPQFVLFFKGGEWVATGISVRQDQI